MRDFDFNFILTSRDRLEAYSAVLAKTSKMRPWIRWLLVVLGVIWLSAAVVNFLEGDYLGAAGALFLGSVVVWKFAVQPLRARVHLRSVRDIMMSLRCTSSGVEVTEDGQEPWRAEWKDLVLLHDSPHGVFLGFREAGLWLPVRVFRDTRERDEFSAYVRDLQPVTP